MRLFLSSFTSDLRYALRGLLRNPRFALAVCATLAVGIGPLTAVFSVAEQLFLRHLPYRSAGRIVSFGITLPFMPHEFLFSGAYFELRNRETPFDALTSSSGVRDCDLTEHNAVRLSCADVEANFLPTLGVDPAFGRNFTREEDRPNAPAVALVSYDLWRSRFGGQPEAIGRTISLDGVPAQIVGVLPSSFEFPTLAPVDVLLPARVPVPSGAPGRPLQVFARLKHGVSIPQATAELQPFFQEFVSSAPPPLRNQIGMRMRSVRDVQIANARVAMLVLSGAVFALLLIACTNVANLLLARSVRRRADLAVRVSLGASRLRLVGQTLAESLLIAVIGGAAGCGLAVLLLRTLFAIGPAAVPRLQHAHVDPRVLLVTALVSIACGIGFGIAPALQKPESLLLSGRTVRMDSGSSLRQVLMAAQVALSLVLLALAGLMLRSFWNLIHEPLGIRTDNIIVAEFTLGEHRYHDAPQQLAFFEQLERNIQRIAGVTASAISDSVPPGQSAHSRPLFVLRAEGRPTTESIAGEVVLRSVTPGYFAALGIPIVRGRGFYEQDREKTVNVAVVSASLARMLFYGDDPIGKNVLGIEESPCRVVGVARDMKNAGISGSSRPEYYVVRKHSADDVIFQYPDSRRASVVVSTLYDWRAIAPQVRAAITSIDAELPIEIRTMRNLVNEQLQRPQFDSVLLSLFAAVGVLLAAVGVYGVVAFVVAQRTAEVGIRMALGATPTAVVKMVLSSAMVSLSAGAAAGLLASVFAARLLRSMLFEVGPNNFAAVGGAVGLLFAIGLLAAWIPARRAASVDPAQTLRTT